MDLPQEPSSPAEGAPGEVTVYASPHRDITLLRNYAFNKDTRVIHVHLTGPDGSMDRAARLAEHRAKLTTEEIGPLLEAMYEYGGSPEFVYLDLDRAEALLRREFVLGNLGLWEYMWHKARFALMRLRGRWRRRGNSGAPSAPPTPGTDPTASP